MSFHGRFDGQGFCDDTRDQMMTAVYFGSMLHCVKVLVRRCVSKAQLNALEIVEKLVDAGDEAACRVKSSVLDQVRRCEFGGKADFGDAEDGSLAYLTAFASSIAAMEPRCAFGADSDKERDPDANLRKIFNYINGRSEVAELPHKSYEQVLENVEKGLESVELSPQGVNGLLRLLEDTVAAVPASTNAEGLIDVSLFDYAKASACFASCAHEYLMAQGGEDYKQLVALDGEKDPYTLPMFLLVSCDLSGIQSFIYCISGDGALRQLRARSLYLEILLEAIVDEVLRRLGMNRANLQYTGGGHCYLLLPNTQDCKRIVSECLEEVRTWLSAEFRTDLYLASSWVECSANDLINADGGQGYASVYRKVSQGLSSAKANRYTAQELRELNFGEAGFREHERECTECHRSDLWINPDGKCSFCAALGEVSRHLDEKNYFVVLDSALAKASDLDRSYLHLPFGQLLDICTSVSQNYDDSSIVSVYEKNALVRKREDSTRIWLADYCAEMGVMGVSAYAEGGISLAEGTGIKRLGVLRADVDNLGATFVSGLPVHRQSFSRSSVLSRSLSYFFKSKVNELLRNGKYQAQVIYSGGDDLFLIGNWSDVIFAAIDIRQALRDFVGSDAITISAGVGMFSPKYPIARMASEVGELEDAAKLYSCETPQGISEKNAVCLWSRENVFGWGELTGRVLPLKQQLESVFKNSDKGKAFIYQLLALLRNYDDVISAPRLAYLLARSFENVRGEAKQKIDDFYRWATNESDRRYFIVALEWYVYSIREGD